MRGLHIADAHFGRAFEGLKHLPEATEERLLAAEEEIIAWFILQARIYQVDFILFAGDTFHQERPSIKVQATFVRMVETLKKDGVAVFLITGNHDYELAENFVFDLPTNLYPFFEEDVETLEVPLKNGETLAVSGFGYRHRWINRTKLSEFPERSSQADWHIGMYHGEVANRKDTEISSEQCYAPFSLAEMRSKKYDYWALGHIHQRKLLDDNIAYAGTPIGHTKKETGLKGCYLLRGEKGKITATFLVQKEILWKKCRIKIKEEDSLSLITLKIMAFWQKEALHPNKQMLLAIKLDKMDEFFTQNPNYSPQEVTEFLRDEIARRTNNCCFLIDVSFAFRTEKSFQISPELLKSLADVYADQGTFIANAEILAKDSLLRNYIELDEGFRHNILAAAQQNLLSMERE